MTRDAPLESPDATDLDVALAAARAGAEVVRSRFGEAGNAGYKGEVDPVTETDLASQEAILSVLRGARPDDALVAEEGDLARDDNAGTRRWIVDPLDGTVNFLHGVPHIAVSVALWDHDAPLVGVVVDVCRDEVFAASRDDGATLDGRPIRTSDRTDLGEALVATGFPYDRRRRADDYTRVVAQALRHVQGVRRIGTASLDLCWVACGRFEAFWEFGLAPWDVAAGLLLVREAGGVVTDHHGRPAGLASPMFVATTAHLHGPFLEMLRPALPGWLPD